MDLCYQCGTCTASCPSGRMTAFRTRQLIRKAQLGLKDDILPTEDLWMCTTCYSCVERCPREVEIIDIIIIMRNMAVKKGYMADAAQEDRRVPDEDRRPPYRSDEDMKQLRVKMGLPADPPITIGDPKALEDFRKIMQKTGFDKLIGGA